MILVLTTIFVAFLAIYLSKKLLSLRISGDYGSKFVLITGCDTGFGNAIAEDLDRLGFQVIACCYNKDSDGALRLLKSCSDRLKLVQLDLTKDEQMKNCHKMVENLCHNNEFWALINNAALSNYISEVESTPMKIIEQLFNVNLFGAIKMIKFFLPLLKTSKGRIINMSSLTATMHLKTMAAYSATKSALETFSDCLRQELKPSGVDVVIIQPSAFKTGGIDACVLQKKYKELCAAIQEESFLLMNKEEDFSALFKHLLNLKEEFRQKAVKASEVNLDPVVAVTREAVVSRRPNPRYKVGRGSTVISIISSTFPTSAVDFIQAYL